MALPREDLALIYVEKNAKQGDTPEKLIALYQEAYKKINEYVVEYGLNH